jgi:putative membrane protein
MKILPLVRVEFARLTANRLSIAALVALMLVPVIYGGLYLWGNRDPYSNLDNVPAALVVNDTGATLDGKPVNYGRDAASQLLKDERFGWVRVSSATAAAGVRTGTYDFAVTFPATFSKDLVSAGDSNPTKASLGLTTNDTNSYLSTTIAKQGAESVRVALAEKVGKQASRQLLNGISTLRAGIVDARNGASTLSGATGKATSGAAHLSSGLAKLDSGAAVLPSGTAKLASGAAQVAAGTRQLSAAAPAAARGATSAASGAAALTAGAGSAASGASTLSAGLGQLAATAPAVRADLAHVLVTSTVPAADQARLLAELDAIDGGIAQSHAGATTLSTGVGRLSSGAQSLSSGLSTLSGKLSALPSKTAQLSAGAARVSSGAASLARSAPALAAGIHSSATGAATLSTGITKIDSGAGKLASSLATGATNVPATTAAQRAATAAVIASPVDVKQAALTQAQNYGAGLAPFFISLSAWIGIYALFLLVRPLSRRALTAVRRPIRTVIAGWATPAVLGAVQMIALFLMVTLGLHLQVANGIGLLGFMVLASITFTGVILALNVLFGSVGQFLGLILMIVQLVTAGGTFPWQTLPGPLAFIHQALPMSSAVEGVRQLMYSGSTNDVSGPILWLLVWLVGSLAVAVWGAQKQGRLRTLRELRPSPIGG